MIGKWERGNELVDECSAVSCETAEKTIKGSGFFKIQINYLQLELSGYILWCFSAERLIFICLLENNFFLKNKFYKINYFLIFNSLIKNKLENTFQYLVMS
jgi:hypothetical protein